MAIANTDQLVNAFNAAAPLDILKLSISAQAAGSFIDLLTAAGNPPAGAVPATGNGTYYDRTSQSALLVPQPATGQTLYLAAFEDIAQNQGVLILYDRIWANSGFSGTLTTPQNVPTPPTLPRWSPGTGVQCWLEVYTALGSTSVTATLSYTNEQGQSGRTASLTIPASMGANRMLPFPLQAGDRGVQTVQGVTLSASTGTAGNFGLTLLRRLPALRSLGANTGEYRDAFGVPLLALPSTVSPHLMTLVNGTTTGLFLGTAVFVTG